MPPTDATSAQRSPASVLPGPEAAKGHLAMLAFSAMVAGSFSLGSMAAPEIDPLALTAVRFLLAALVIGGIVAARGIARRAHFRAGWRYLVLGGLFATYFVLMFEGLKTAPPIATSAIFTLTPILSAGFGWLVLRQVTTRRMALALAIAGLGAVWVIFDADLAALARLDLGRGEVIYFLGCIAHALYAPMVPRLGRGEPVLVLTFGMLIGGTLCLGVVGGPAVLATDWLALPAIVWITLFYISFIAGAATFLLIQYAAFRLPSAKVMAYTYLTPSFVILWEGALGNGWPPLGVLAGVAAVIGGLFLLLKD
ncbi:DMT family transporter [Halovulum dunhuangense]|uniref:DMT family transporter n=1 Tax=Halovulum dunhuangense TaxID=1505036 RepID=A0A849KVX0_9RHOB|nr:DMT family transporter [Halovulum dunhuangense]NNU79598.1 DMT family transporter [Halovulum dunhuangense]